MQLVAVLVAEVAALLVGGQVDLAEEDRLAAAAAEEGPQIAQVLVRIELHRLGRAVDLEQERHGVDAEPGRPWASQKPMSLRISSRTSADATLRSGWWR